MNKSKGLTFFLSFIPGLGHLYLGLMNRGLQLMILFISAIFFAEALRLIGLAIPIIWFFSLFDALQQHKNMQEKNEILDIPFIEWGDIQNKKFLFGWGLIILGAIYLFEKLSRYFFDWQVYEIVQNVLIGGLLVLVGYRLISGKSIFPKEIKRLPAPKERIDQE